MSLVDAHHNLEAVITQGQRSFAQIMMGIAHVKEHVLSSPPLTPPLPNLDIWPVYAGVGALIITLPLLGLQYLVFEPLPERPNPPVYRNPITYIGLIIGGYFGTIAYLGSHK